MVLPCAEYRCPRERGRQQKADTGHDPGVGQLATLAEIRPTIEQVRGPPD